MNFLPPEKIYFHCLVSVACAYGPYALLYTNGILAVKAVKVNTITMGEMLDHV